MSITYPGSEGDLDLVGLPDRTRFVSAGYYAAPRAGQWYISGAVPMAYRAPHSLSIKYWIAYPVTNEDTANDEP